MNAGELGPVLHVTTRREWRGGEVQVLRLLEQLGGVLAAPEDAALSARWAGERRAVGFHGPFGGWSLPRVVRALRPALICAHDANASRHVAPLGVPWVAHRRIDDRPSRAHAGLLRAALGVVAVSDAVAAVLRGAGVGRVRVVRDGVVPPPGAPDRAGVRARLGIPPDAPLLVAVGALVPHKGHATLVDALRELPGVHAAILGEGREREALRARSAAAWVGGRLHLLGQRDDVGVWLRSADLVVHPSLTEGLGQAVLEALAVGAPVVTSDAGGLPEIRGARARFPRGDPAALAAVVRAHLGAGPQGARVRSVEALAVETRAAWASFLGDAGGPIR